MKRRMQTRRRFITSLAQAGAALSLLRTTHAVAATPAERVLVIGAAGRLGSRIVSGLAAKGYAVRAFVRATTNATLPKGVERANGELGDRDALHAALTGVDRVVFTASAGGSRRPGNLPEAAPPTLKQMVLISSSAVTQPLHPHNAWSDLLLWKLKGEEHLRASGVRYTIVRPTGMRDYAGGTEGIGFAQGDTFAFGYVICRDDAAAVVVAAVGTLGAVGKTLEAYNDPSIAVGPLENKFLLLRTDSDPYRVRSPQTG
jgi:uncharacterized protein YbjT (DUF2867 family)